VPLLGCDCAVCASADPRDRRRRSSVLVEHGGARLLVDASPDLRNQLLDAGVARLDAVLFSHAHADHCHGLDDIRLVCRAMNAVVPVYGATDTPAELRTRFGYAFDPVSSTTGWFRPALEPRTIDGPFDMAGIPVVPFTQRHGSTMTTLGFRFGGFAYSTDVSDLDDAAFAALDGLDTWVVDCQSFQPTYVHSHLDRTLGWIERARPRRAVLTHMGHDFAYRGLSRRLPKGVEPGYDGLVLEVEDRP
jgi:phosphoribosyl 1,2-cyclic phosphate phosphodiesterase